MKRGWLKSFVEGHPRFWTIAWRLLHTSSIFLPHDPTYLALRHLSREEGGLILDVGANQGISALSFRKLCPHYQIISIEPNRVNQKYLEGIKKKHENFDYLILGLADKVGELVLYTPVYGRVLLHTFTSLDKEHLQEALRKTYSQKVLDKIFIEETICDVRPLDDLGLSPSIMKIDAEGLELQILQGGSQTISMHRPNIIFEACHKDLAPVRKILELNGYVLLKYDPVTDIFSRADGGSIQYISGLRNLIAVRKEEVATLPFSRKKWN